MAQMTFDEAEDEQDKMDAANMAATAAKLYAGINAPTGDGSGNNDYFAGYDATNNANINVTIGTGDASGTAVPLSEDKDATVAPLHGWTGMRFTAELEGGGTYEAYVYSHVGEPTMGAKFNDSANGGYTLNADDQIADVTSVTDYAGLVASLSFDQSAGTKTFNLPDPNPGGATRINVAGSFNGVSGTYGCTPTTPADGCSVTVAASGFTLAGGTWTFEPNDPEARLMNVPDNSYASYGWWLRKSADGNTFTASAFVDERGGQSAAASGITALQGTAKYMGGAAGKYALSSSTGGTNDAGHFTARATLEADFGDDTITGTIDQFVGADGQSRDWSVALNESTVSDAGAIAGDPETSGNTEAQMTVWTLGGTAAAASGQWSGSLRETGDDGVPAIGTGTFYTEYGTAGKMVGAFGVNKQ